MNVAVFAGMTHLGLVSAGVVVSKGFSTLKILAMPSRGRLEGAHRIPPPNLSCGQGTRIERRPDHRLAGTGGVHARRTDGEIGIDSLLR
jgi:hypothetical protein